MSQLERQKENKAGRNGAKRSKANQSRFVTFHPTEADKKELKDKAYDLTWAWEVIEGRLDRGCSLSLSVRDDGSSYCAMIWDASLDWEERTMVTSFHSDLDRAVLGLAYALEKRHPDFPEIAPSRVQTVFDW